MPYLISYDISHNYQRQKIAEKLIESGLDRIQRSVYMGSVDPERMKTLIDWLQERMNSISQIKTDGSEAKTKKTRTGLLLNLEIFKSILPKSTNEKNTANKKSTNNLIIINLSRPQVKEMIIMGNAGIDTQEITGDKTTLIF